jgi:hypothetical protein
MPPSVGYHLRARIPEHVVHRDFSDETVVLNLATGQYHGLNYTARRMLATLNEAENIGRATVALAKEFGVQPARIEQDVLDLCAALSTRGLLELNDDPTV